MCSKHIDIKTKMSIALFGQFSYVNWSVSMY